MKLRQLYENGGLIVPGVNTTADVGPDEIKKQAAKLGLKVDKKGIPAYNMHKKAHKNSDPNTLFNLGLAESKEEIWNEWKIMPQTIKPMGLVHKAGKGPNNRFDYKNKGNNKANEASEQEISSASEIYVDMDGVLVDFFDAWTKLLGVNDWKEIKDVPAALQKIRDTKDFWIDLKPTSNSQNLLNIIKDLKGEYTILSAPMSDDERVEPSKREWVKKHLTQFPPKEVIISANKSQYATQSDGTPNILIDDFGQNVSKWEASGGVGFKHKDHKFERTANNLKQYFEKPVEERELSKMAESAHKEIKKVKFDADLKLPNGKNIILQADDKDHTRGLVIRSNADGSYDSYYWYNDPKKKYPIEIKIDNKSVSKDAKNINWKYHPELKESVEERSLSKGEEKKKEKYVKGMKKSKGDFKDRYGKDADAVMYATATKMAKEGDLIPLPKNSFSVDSDATDYDFMKLGRNMANIATTNKDDANMGDQDIMLNFFGGDVEAKHMIKNLKRLGYKVGDVSGYQDHNFDPEPTDGEEPPQVKSKDVPKFISHKGKVPLDKLKPVQRDRSWAKLGKALQRTGDKKYSPILVDRDGYIVNGHHRYDSLRLRGQREARVHMINGSLKEIMQLMKR